MFLKALVIIAIVFTVGITLGMELSSTVHKAVSNITATNDAHRINAGKVGHGK